MKDVSTDDQMRMIVYVRGEFDRPAVAREWRGPRSALKYKLDWFQSYGVWGVVDTTQQWFPPHMLHHIAIVPGDDI